MNILLVNDDGINAIGIKRLEELFKNYGDVYVSAPATQQSAKGASITVFSGVFVNQLDEHHIAVNGTPVDCIEIGACLFNKKFDLVVSGCNNGYNLAHDIMYSGTCNACFQASIASFKAVAFSIYSEDYDNYIVPYGKIAFDYILKHDLLSKDYYLNVNLPNVKDLKGIKITKVYDKIHEKYFIKSNDGRGIIVARDHAAYDKLKEGYDYYEVNNGYISISPISQTAFSYKAFKKINKKVKENID